MFWLVLVLAAGCSSALGGHVADIFHLFVFDPTLGTGRLFKNEIMSHLC